jgi:hypothetical protein
MGAMNKPLFQHDCDKCEFLGHFFDHDVYICSPQGFETCVGKTASVIARYGDNGPEYTSSLVSVLKEQFFSREHTIGLAAAFGINEPMVFQDFLFSEYAFDAYKAMVLALAKRGMEPNEEG